MSSVSLSASQSGAPTPESAKSIELQTAATRGNLEGLAVLLAEGADPNGNFGFPPITQALYRCARKKSSATRQRSTLMALLLLKYGASPIPGPLCRSPAYASCMLEFLHAMPHGGEPLDRGQIECRDAAKRQILLAMDVHVETILNDPLVVTGKIKDLAEMALWVHAVAMAAPSKLDALLACLHGMAPNLDLDLVWTRALRTQSITAEALSIIATFFPPSHSIIRSEFFRPWDALTDEFEGSHAQWTLLHLCSLSAQPDIFTEVLPPFMASLSARAQSLFLERALQCSIAEPLHELDREIFMALVFHPKKLLLWQRAANPTAFALLTREDILKICQAGRAAPVISLLAELKRQELDPRFALGNDGASFAVAAALGWQRKSFDTLIKILEDLEIDPDARQGPDAPGGAISVMDAIIQRASSSRRLTAAKTSPLAAAAAWHSRFQQRELELGVSSTTSTPRVRL
jgi:hypothetical protein